MAQNTPATTSQDGSTSASSTQAPGKGEEWPDRAADLLESTVTTVRTKTVDPLGKIARVVVFALILAVAGLAVLLLLIIALIRLVNAYLPLHPHSRAVWVTYAGLGAIFVLAGVFMMRKKQR